MISSFNCYRTSIAQQRIEKLLFIQMRKLCNALVHMVYSIYYIRTSLFNLNGYREKKKQIKEEEKKNDNNIM